MTFWIYHKWGIALGKSFLHTNISRTAIIGKENSAKQRLRKENALIIYYPTCWEKTTTNLMQKLKRNFFGSVFQTSLTSEN